MFTSADFDAWYQNHQGDIIDSLREFISFSTVSPNDDIANQFLVGYLRHTGFQVRTENIQKKLFLHPEVSPHPAADRSGHKMIVRAQRRIDINVPTTLFNCHVDVVPASDEFPEAFSPVVRDGKLFGRGACDTKNNLVMLVEAIRFLDDQGVPLSVNISLDLPVEEEIGGNGTLSTIIQGIEADEAIVLEPTELIPYRGHRGCLSFAVDVSGTAVHMGSDSVGLSAIDGAIEVINRLRALEQQRLTDARKHPAFAIWPKPIQLNIGLIQGGEWSGSVPEHCRIVGDFGFLPEQSLAEVEQSIKNAVNSSPSLWVRQRASCSFDVGLRNGAYLDAASSQALRILSAAAHAEGVLFNEVYAWKVSCDARHYANIARIPTVVFGSGSLDVAHSSSEHVELSELRRGMKILARYLCAARKPRVNVSRN